jgi:putative transcriptional regulator
MRRGGIFSALCIWANSEFLEAPLRMVRYRRFAMTTKTKTKSRIFEAVHETASDLHRLGFIDKRKMRKFDVLCLDPVPEYDSAKIRALRDHLQLSQAVLAAVLNTSLSTVRKWEIGEKHPSGPSLKLLNLLERKGLEAVL